ncbi:MAG: YlxR family protein [Clostridia bacterium]|nr:YlxR family protein [Clostridiales bacterium]MBQ3505685.1 YlxR family protein [Clostridia bacterium]
MAKTKSVPMRMCIACREMKPKKEMFRVVKNADGEIYADVTGKAPGRGAYICNADECRKKLNDKKLLHKVFSTNVSDVVYKGVEEKTLEK